MLSLGMARKAPARTYSNRYSSPSTFVPLVEFIHDDRNKDKQNRTRTVEHLTTAGRIRFHRWGGRSDTDLTGSADVIASVCLFLLLSN